MPTNYMLDAMQGYNFVDNIYRNKRNDALRLEDREFQKQRIARQDVREDKESAYLDKIRGREEKAYQDKMSLRDINVAEIESKSAADIERIFGPAVSGNPQAAMKAGGLLKDPVRTGKIIALNEEVGKYLAAGKTPPNELSTELLNLVDAEDLAARGGDDGLSRNVESIVPSNKPGEVMIGLNVTGKDGKTYQAPMTTGASADPADNQVQSIPVQKLIERVNGGTAAAKAIAIARAKLGDNSYLDAHRAARIELAKRKADLADYEQKKKIDAKYKENKPVAAGRWGMYDPATGKFITNPATQGINGGKWVTDEDGTEHYVGGGKGGKQQTLKTQFNDDGSVSVYDPNTDKLKVVRTEEQKKELSVQMAEQWAEDQSEGILNLRPKDELIQAKQTEFYNQLNGGPGSQEPMVTVTQNGQTFQVPASLVRQHTPTQPKPTPKPKPKPTTKKKPKPTPAQNSPAKNAMSKPDFGLTKNTGRVIVGNDLGKAASGLYDDTKKRFEDLRKNK